MSLHPSSSPSLFRRVACLLGVCAGFCITFPALASNGIGSVTRINQSVTGKLSGRPLVMSVGDAVKQNESVRTDASGEARVTFVDYANLVIFSGSSIKLDRFILDSPDRARSVIMSTADGTFEFDSGNSAGAYRINTTAGSLTPHGTRFTFTVRGGRLRLDVEEGAVTFCPRGKSQAYCVVATPGHSVLGSAGAPAQVLGINETPVGPPPTIRTGSGPPPDCRQTGSCVPIGCWAGGQNARQGWGRQTNEGCGVINHRGGQQYGWTHAQRTYWRPSGFGRMTRFGG
jgi:FecR protein